MCACSQEVERICAQRSSTSASCARAMWRTTLCFVVVCASCFVVMLLVDDIDTSRRRMSDAPTTVRQMRHELVDAATNDRARSARGRRTIARHGATRGCDGRGRDAERGVHTRRARRGQLGLRRGLSCIAAGHTALARHANAQEPGHEAGLWWQPRADSNCRYRLERAAS